MAVVLPEVVSTQIWQYGYFESEVCGFLLSHLREGMTFVDIGAHVGFFTLLGSYLVGIKGKVFSFEPTPRTYELLSRNVANRTNVQSYACAAFSENTVVTLHDCGLRWSAFNSLFEPRMTGKPGVDCCRVSVRARTVDDVLREAGSDRVDLVKVDAESSEVHVLQGMTETLGVSRPALIVEVGGLGIPEATESEAVVAWLQGMGYYVPEIEQLDGGEHMWERCYTPGNLLFLPGKQGGETREWGRRGVGAPNGVSLQHRG